MTLIRELRFCSRGAGNPALKGKPRTSAGERIVHSERTVEFQFAGGREFQLRPSSHRIQRPQLTCGRIATEEHAPSHRAAQTAQRRGRDRIRR